MKSILIIGIVLTSLIWLYGFYSSQKKDEEIKAINGKEKELDKQYRDIVSIK